MSPPQQRPEPTASAGAAGGFRLAGAAQLVLQPMAAVEVVVVEPIETRRAPWGLAVEVRAEQRLLVHRAMHGDSCEVAQPLRCAHAAETTAAVEVDDGDHERAVLPAEQQVSRREVAMPETRVVEPPRRRRYRREQLHRRDRREVALDR